MHQSMQKEHIQPPTCFVIELKSWILKDDEYDNGWLLNNIRHTHLKGENEFKLQDLVFITKHKQIPSPTTMVTQCQNMSFMIWTFMTNVLI